MKISCAVIDFDGTLVDSMPYWRSLPMNTLSEMGLAEPEGFRERICSRPMWEVAEYLPTLYPTLTKEGLRDQWDGRMLRHYREDIRLKPGSRELLSLLRQRGMKLILLSATRQPYLDTAVDIFSLRPCFDMILTEEEAGAKHRPDTFRRLAERLGCPLEEMLLIEDSPANLRSAVSAGVRTAAVFDESKTLWWEALCRETDIQLKDPADRTPLLNFLEEKDMELEKLLADLVLNDPENRLAKDVALSPELAGMPFFGAPLVRVGDAHDPLFAAQRKPEAVGPWFRLPTEWLPEAKTVISVFFPYTDDVKSRENAREEAPSPAWLHARIEGNDFMFKVMERLKGHLIAQGHKAVIPTREKEFASVWGPGSNENFADPTASYSSVWSERHVGFVCGMGTFGLSGGLITEKGVCGRLSSLVTDAPLPVTKRAYSQVYEYCTRCGVCAAHCPVKAISLETGKCHAPCGDRLNRTKVLYAPRYGCGKCQIDVPCMSRIPQGE